ncbi:hypothetical protein M413DRAFT_131644 [Hebeloma cylindrosporum]|uniref:Uncharacterized protein n=1 Tax=Hebeloma cylindrosporum TaxID=76867 RepID=A0A0C3C0C9_HEBCY|nr:hypothetical protein M413DRAFT_131644 [Hebeloma cylindrosporum h7]
MSVVFDIHFSCLRMLPRFYIPLAVIALDSLVSVDKMKMYVISTWSMAPGNNVSGCKSPDHSTISLFFFCQSSKSTP